MTNSEFPPPQSILFPDILRIMAVFAVIMIHICAYGFYNYDVSCFDWQIINAYECLIRCAVPIFVMINGIFYRIGLSEMNIPVILSIPLRTILAFVLSFLVVCVLVRIPIVNKYCM